MELQKWFGCVRKTYNWALSELKNKHKKLVWWKDHHLKNRFVTKCNIPNKYKYLHEDTPKHIREGAIKDLKAAFSTNIQKRKKKPKHTWDVKYRSKKDVQAIVIPSTVLKGLQKQPELTSQRYLRMYPTYLWGALSYHVKSLGDVKFHYDCRLTFDKLNRFYLHVPFVRICDNQASDQKGTVALDPGVRTFMTGYSPQGSAFSIGDRDISRIQRHCQHLDDLLSRTERAPKAKQWRMKRAITKARYRIQTLSDEVHWKAIKYLTSRFSKIYIPSFNVGDMVKRVERRINRKTVRQMLCWRHFAFRQRLLQTAAREGISVIVCTEEYTSKTCTNCGHLHTRLGGNKRFRCPSCGWAQDRDLNGARNIFLKSESATKSCRTSCAASAALPR
jgi:putative transposase